MAAYGLYSHIQSNKRRSIALLISLFLLVYLLVYAGALAAEALSYDASVNWYLQRAWRDFLQAAPWATIGTIVWVVIAYYFHQSMIDAVTGGRDVTRAEEPRLYNLLENLCISRGITMPKPRRCLATNSPISAMATCACWSSPSSSPASSRSLPNSFSGCGSTTALAGAGARAMTARIAARAAPASRSSSQSRSSCSPMRCRS